MFSCTLTENSLQLSTVDGTIHRLENKPNIDDSTPSTTKVYSSDKTQSLIDDLNFSSILQGQIPFGSPSSYLIGNNDMTYDPDNFIFRVRNINNESVNIYKLYSAPDNYKNFFNINPEVNAVLDGMTGVTVNGYGTSAPTFFNGVDIHPFFTGSCQSMNGYNVSIGMDITQNFNAFTCNIDNNKFVSGFTGINMFSSSSSSVDYYNGIQINPDNNMVINNSFNGVSVFSQNNCPDCNGLNVNLGGTYSNGFNGFNMYTNTTATNYGYGININMQGTAPFVTGLNINVESHVTTGTEARPVGISNQGVFSSFVNCNLFSNKSGIVDGGNNMICRIDSIGDKVETDFLGVNFACLGNFRDNYTKSTSIGIGVAAVGCVGQLAAAQGKVVSDFTMMLGGVGITPVSDATDGGTIDNLYMFNALGCLPFGGTIVVNNMYGFAYYNNKGYTPTNEWGIYIDNTIANNYVKKNLIVGNTVPTNESCGIELNSTTQSLLLSRLTTTQRDALTPLNGMALYNTTTAQTEVYQNNSWDKIRKYAKFYMSCCISD